MEWIAEAALRSLLVAALVRLAIAVLRITNPQQERIIWTTLLAGALLMPILVHWSLLPALPVNSFAAPTQVVHDLGTSGTPLRHPSWIFAVYSSVSLLLLLRMVSGVIRMWNMKCLARPIREPWTLGLDVRVTTGLPSAATFGTTILLPPDYLSWSEAKRSIILQHEEAHVRHYDSQIQWLAALHASLFWFSPLAWWLRRRLAQLAEYASDDHVLRGQVLKVDYATILLEEAQRPTVLPLVSIAGRALEQRVDRILSAGQPAKVPSRARRTLAALGVIPVIVLAAEGPAQQPPTKNPLPAGAPAAIVGSPSLEDLAKYYPPEAAAKGIDGLVQITVTLDSAGRATDTHIVSEKPAGLGFGAAASELAHQFKYAKPAARSASVTYRIKFELDRAQAAHAASSGP